MKAIETCYKGYLMRSRIEARWAIFFDALGILWEYEKEGFDMDGTWYLPDFWLPRQKCWIEIKGQEPIEREVEKCRSLATNLPGTRVFLFRGNIPLPSQQEDTGMAYQFVFDPQIQECVKDSGYGWLECPFCNYVDISVLGDFVLTCHCVEQIFNVKELHNEVSKLAITNLTKFDFVFDRLLTWNDTPRLIAAYTAARQARFEHKENTR